MGPCCSKSGSEPSRSRCNSDSPSKGAVRRITTALKNVKSSTDPVSWGEFWCRISLFWSSGICPFNTLGDWWPDRSTRGWLSLAGHAGGGRSRLFPNLAEECRFKGHTDLESEPPLLWRMWKAEERGPAGRSADNLRATLAARYANMLGNVCFSWTWTLIRIKSCVISAELSDDFHCNDFSVSADRCCRPPCRVGVVVLYSYRDDYYKILVWDPEPVHHHQGRHLRCSGTSRSLLRPEAFSFLTRLNLEFSQILENVLIFLPFVLQYWDGYWTLMP